MNPGTEQHTSPDIDSDIPLPSLDKQEDGSWILWHEGSALLTLFTDDMRGHAGKTAHAIMEAIRYSLSQMKVAVCGYCMGIGCKSSSVKCRSCDGKGILVGHNVLIINQ